MRRWESEDKNELSEGKKRALWEFLTFSKDQVTPVAATISASILCLAPGIWFLWNSPLVERRSRELLRDCRVAAVLMGLGTAWFLSNVLELRPADFGDYKFHLFGFFLAVALGSWFFTKDFLAVRGGAILVLLLAELFLRSVFGLYEEPGRLVLVTGCYMAIVVAMYFGALPYRLRDFLGWLFARPLRVRCLGGFLVCYGLGLSFTAFLY